MAVTIFRSRHGTLAYKASATTWSTGTELNDVSLTGDVAELKDITVGIPEQTVEKVDLLGATAQTIGINARTAGTATGIIAGNFQNQMLNINSIGTFTVSGTMVLTGNEQFIHAMGLGSGTSTGGGTATRYPVGAIASNNWAKTLVGALRFFLNNGSEEFTVVMSNTIIKKLSDIKPTGSSGHLEVDFEAECLAKDGAIEFLD